MSRPVRRMAVLERGRYREVAGRWRRTVGIVAVGLAIGIAGMQAQAGQPAAGTQPLNPGADLVLLNGQILSVDDASSIYEALAVRDGRVVALGRTAELRRLASPGSRVIDLGGRTVIPGLIDSHMHAIRAGLSFATEVNWIGAPTLVEALGRIHEAAETRPETDWIIVAGGWNVDQFEERHRPTQAELVAAAPNHPVYVQLGYGWAMLTPRAHERLGITGDDALPAGGRLERDADGGLTGAVTGGIVALFDRLPRPTFAQQVEGTRRFFRELNRLGLTGVIDPGGNNLGIDDYQALFTVWRRGELTVRVRFSLGAQHDGSELSDFQAWTHLLPMGFGDALLRFNGLGERVTGAMNNNDNPSEADKQRYQELVQWAASQGLTLTMHWGANASVGHLLDIFERVNEEYPLAPLRWSIAHLNDASDETLRRMRALGIGWTVQDAMYFGGDQLVRRVGPEAARRVPPLVTARRFGVPVGGGTDAHRVASYNPFTALQWFVDGKSVTGATVRGAEERPTRMEALRLYTQGSAWFAHDDDERGTLEVGRQADLAVLTDDYLTMPVERIGQLESLLTLLGGRVVYAAGPFAGMED